MTTSPSSASAPPARAPSRPPPAAPTAQVVVLGGGYAGVLAARRIAAHRAARVTLIDRRDHFVERIRLHQVAAGQALPARPLAPMLGRARLRVAEVRAIDVAARRVVLADGVIDVDHLVVALGSATRVPVQGAEHALRLDDPATARAVGAAATAAVGGPHPLAIVGGGLTAIEAATELVDAHPGLRVVLLCRGRLGEALGEAAVARVRAALARRGVEVREHAAVAALEPGRVVVDGAALSVAGAVWCAGFAASPLLAAAGLAVDPLGRMLVDDTLTVADAPWLHGAGDAAVPRDPVGAPIVMACKTALPMAAAAADAVVAALADRAPRRFRFGDSAVCVSLGRRDGVIQLRDDAGRNRRVIGGRAGAMIKESVCRFTVRALRHPALQASFRLYARGGQRALDRAASATTPLALPAAE